MNATADLAFRLADAPTRRALSAVLAPDNEGLPRGIALSSSEDGDVLRFRVVADSSTAALSTVLALLRDVALFQEVWLLSRTARG